MGHRRKARVLALQLLYQVDLSNDDLEHSMAIVWDGSNLSEEAKLFAETIAREVDEHLKKIDGLIQGCSKNWRLGRMPIVDRNILRVAVCEMLFHPEIPKNVSINEAIEIGKQFGAAQSGAFINGLLDQIRKKIDAA